MSAPLDLVLGRLEGVRKNGKGYEARCPAHDDRNPSLSVSLGERGEVLLHCHAGCEFERVLSALELDKADLFPRDESRKREIVARYDYANEAGELLFQVVRFEPKGFAQRRPEGTGWAWSLNGVRRVPYRLPRIAEAARVGGTVFVAEGEKDVHSLEGLGLTATCCPGGAGKWRGEYAELFRGVGAVVVIPDDDTPGRAHAETVAASLAGIVPKVKVVELFPEGDTGSDVSDWLAKADRPEQAKALLRATVRATPEFPPADAGGIAPFEGLRHEEVLALEFETERYLVDDLIPSASLVTYAGVPETYKSWLAQATAVAVARGEGEILGQRVVSGGPAGYFWQDDSTREEAERIRTYQQAHDTPPDLPLTWFLNVGLVLPEHFDRLRATIEAHGLVLCVLDSFYNVALGLELEKPEAAVVFAQLKALASETGCTFLIVDHMAWATETNRKRLRSYGAVFKNAAVRAGVYIDAEGKKLWAEARGNNIRGFKRTPVFWDEEQLELRLVDVQRVEDEELERRVLEFVGEHPGCSSNELEKGVEGSASRKREARERLVEAGRITNSSSVLGGRGKTSHSWVLAQEAPLQFVPEPGTNPDEL